MTSEGIGTASGGRQGGSLITPERVRNYSLILLVGGVLALVASAFSRIIEPASAGALMPDFLAHWTGGRLVLDGRADELYSLQAQREVQARIGGKAGDLSWFVSPPFVAALYAPLAVLPYASAAAAWTLASFGGLCVSAIGLGRFAPRLWHSQRGLVLLVCASAYPVFELVGAGQESSLSLAVWVTGIALTLRGRSAAAGLVFALGLAKPQLVVLVPVVFLLQRQFRGLFYFVLGGALLSLASLALVGREGVYSWVSALASPVYAEQVSLGQAWKMPSLPALVTALLGPIDASAAILAGTVVAVFMAGVFVFWLWRSGATGMRVWSAALATTVAASPHLLLYDALLLLPVALFLLETDRAATTAGWLAAAYVLAWLAPALHMAQLGQDWPLTAVGAPWVAVPVAYLWWRVLISSTLGGRSILRT